ncbi:6-bladed beta-propeller [Bacteroides sp.]|uniref:6-bladed beta-propeller n=1 Tax=Bacteroides sp. TaxID=29523 RepID=UPI002A804A39|nr:6-bladed beta-propeller [Bacteroides sp.]
MKHLSFILWLSVLFIGCSPSSETRPKDIIEINVPLHQEDNIIKLSTIIDSIDYVPLATDNEYLIGNVDKLIVTDDSFYIIDKDISFSIYCFNKKGKFIRKIGNRGASDKEYVSITDVNIYNEKIYIWDSSSRKLLIYKSNGDFIRSISSDYAAESIAILNDSQVAFYGDYKHNYKFEDKGRYPNLLTLDLDNRKIDTDLFYEESLSTSGITRLPNNISNNKYLIMPLNDTIYQILPSEVERKYVINYRHEFKKAQENYIKRLKTEKVTVDDAMAMAGESAQFPIFNVFFEGNNFSYFFYQMGYHIYFGFYYPQSQIYVEASANKKNPIENDIDGLARFLPYAVHKDFLYCVMEPSAILEHAEWIPASQKAKVNKLKSEDNPIIVAMKMKKQ